MLSINEALAIVLEGVRPLTPVTLDLAEALGCVLAQEVIAPEDVPPFTNSAMDGYAVRSRDTLDAPVDLCVIDTALAGHPAAGELRTGEAIRIMTGAALPLGADAVCMVEHSHPGADATSVVITTAVRPGQHVRSPGEDLRRGERVCEPGAVLGPAHLGLLASLGLTGALVYPRPRVGVLSVGDELVEGPGPLASGKIRDSNRLALLGVVRTSGFVGIDLGIVRDDRERLKDSLAGAAVSCDAVLTSGGVSVGDADLVSDVLAELCGGTTPSMRVAVKPAKPFAFGRLVTSGTPVFGLPGNPVSALVSFELFARPALRRMAGHGELFRPTLLAVADEPLERRSDGKVHIVSVRARVAADGLVHVRSAGTQAAHVLSTMANANALAVLVDGSGATAGERVEIMLLGADGLGRAGDLPSSIAMAES